MKGFNFFFLSDLITAQLVSPWLLPLSATSK